MTDYLVASGLSLMGPPEPGPTHIRLDEEESGFVKFVSGLKNAELAAAQIGANYSKYGVKVYKVVEVATYGPRSKGK